MAGQKGDLAHPRWYREPVEPAPGKGSTCRSTLEAVPAAESAKPP